MTGNPVRRVVCTNVQNHGHSCHTSMKQYVLMLPITYLYNISLIHLDILLVCTGFSIDFISLLLIVLWLYHCCWSIRFHHEVYKISIDISDWNQSKILKLSITNDFSDVLPITISARHPRLTNAVWNRESTSTHTHKLNESRERINSTWVAVTKQLTVFFCMWAAEMLFKAFICFNCSSHLLKHNSANDLPIFCSSFLLF